MVKETLEKCERPNSEKKEVIRRKLDIKDEIEKVNNSNDSLKEMVEKQNNKEEASSVQIICKKLEIEIDLQKEKEFSLKKDIKRQKSLIETNKANRKNSEKLCRKIETKEKVGKVKDMLKPKDNSTLKESLRRKPKVGEKIEQEIVNDEGKNHNSLKEKIDENLESIERSIIYTQNDNLTELIKKIEILNAPLDIEKTREITGLNTIDLLDNEKTDRYVRNTICHKCKKYGHTKKQCDRHNKNVKRISKLEFEKDIINELMEIFNVNQTEIDQVKKEKELKSTNPLKIIIIKLIENLPDHHKDKKEYLLSLKDSIDIPIVCIRCKKYGHHVTDCRKEEKAKNEKDKNKTRKSRYKTNNFTRIGDRSKNGKTRN